VIVDVGTSAFAAVMGFETVFTLELGGAPETGLAAVAAADLTGLAGTAGPAFKPGVALEPGLPVGLVAGLAAALDVAVDEAGTELGAGLAADGEDAVAELVGAAGFVFGACFGAAGAAEAEPL
jgi:hypothetical protein